MDYEKQSLFFYLLFFILFYYLASLLSNVAATIHYQIMLYPIILIMAGISISQLLHIKNKKIFVPSFILLIIILIYPLYKIKPYYMSYVSTLLPSKYYLDHKDMGLGSYEAASFLNSLPNAKKLSIWSDKKGVCTFFIGTCVAYVNTKKIQRDDYDYYVVSSGREKMVSRKFKLRKNKPARNRLVNLGLCIVFPLRTLSLFHTAPIFALSGSTWGILRELRLPDCSRLGVRGQRLEVRGY